MTDYTYSPQLKPKKRRSRVRWILLGVAVLVCAWFAPRIIGGIGNATITVVNRLTNNTDGTPNDPKLPKISEDPEYTMPDNDKKRLDILILGMRGEGDAQNGGLLTDTMLLFSMDTETGVASLVSIPRDLTVRVTDTKTEKINTAYIHNGVGGTRKLLSRITGVGIDNVIVFDFAAFQSIVDTIGGVTITLDKPFEESQQWAGTASESYVFSLPAGENTLTGEQALYYVRSRYGTSDFDRSRRQMQVVLGIKNKVIGLGLDSDPLKALEIVQAIRKHIDTDLNIFDIGTLKNLAEQGDALGKIKRYQLTTENVLYETKIDGIYELLPRDNTLIHVKNFFRTVLTDSPVLPTPSVDASPSTPTLQTP